MIGKKKLENALSRIVVCMHVYRKSRIYTKARWYNGTYQQQRSSSGHVSARLLRHGIVIFRGRCIRYLLRGIALPDNTVVGERARERAQGYTREHIYMYVSKYVHWFSARERCSFICHRSDPPVFFLSHWFAHSNRNLCKVVLTECEF